jgi:hypothetical protein
VDIIQNCEVSSRSVVLEAFRRRRDLDLATFEDRFSIVQGLESGELVDALENPLADLRKEPARSRVTAAHGPGMAARAAATASSMSGGPAAATVPRLSSVAGLMTGSRAAVSLHSPLMNSLPSTSLNAVICSPPVERRTSFLEERTYAFLLVF